MRLGRRFVFGVLAAGIAAVLVMEWALLSHDFSLQYVADNNARGTPLLFTITGLWAALEGSILLWLLVLGGFLAFAAHKFRSRAADPLVAWATLVGLAIALFFFALVLGPANPFKTLDVIPSDGNGPNPLLQNHPLMAFHPPMLYLGYVGFTIPFMFAIAALITGRFGEGWLADTRRATLVAWGFLSVGRPARRLVELRGPRLGRVLGVGPGRERVVAALADRDRVHPFGDRAGAARDAPRLEPLADRRDLLSDHPRDVPHPIRRHQLRALVHRIGHRAVAAGVPRVWSRRPGSG